ncbi:zinc finger CCCH domain-containing protein 14-like isoform X2 [Carex rostrata]
MVGCPFGDGCHFLHHVPGGYNAVLQMNNYAVPAQHHMAPQAAPSGRFQAGLGGPNSPAVKSKLCSRYSTAEGCKYGDKCRFAHGERDLGRPINPHDYAPGPPMVAPGPMPGGGGAPPPGSFGMSATAKISVEASLAGAIIGKGGINTKQICRVTGTKLAIRDHESDPNLKNIELEGTFDQINHASEMVRELIFNVSGGGSMMSGGQKGRGGPGGAYTAGSGGNNYKTKLCDNFAKGVCTFGEKCNFAHGANELRQSGTGTV